jgi:hypothetical protein
MKRIDIASAAVYAVPDVIPLLGSAFYKTYDYMLGVITHAVTSVYNGFMGGEFVDILQSLITGQLTQAFNQAWEDSGETSFSLPDYLQSALDAMIQTNINFDFIYGYYTDIVDARVDGTPLQPLLSRADLWANRYNEAYNQAAALIVQANGGKLEWVLGATEQHCQTCAALNGIVAYAWEWEEAGVHPQSAPNHALECGGWKCDCSLSPTDKRKTRGAMERIMQARHGVN